MQADHTAFVPIDGKLDLILGDGTIEDDLTGTRRWGGCRRNGQRSLVRETSLFERLLYRIRGAGGNCASQNGAGHELRMLAGWPPNDTTCESRCVQPHSAANADPPRVSIELNDLGHFGLTLYVSAWLEWKRTHDWSSSALASVSRLQTEQVRKPMRPLSERQKVQYRRESRVRWPHPSQGRHRSQRLRIAES